MLSGLAQHASCFLLCSFGLRCVDGTACAVLCPLEFQAQLLRDGFAQIDLFLFEFLVILHLAIASLW